MDIFSVSTRRNRRQVLTVCSAIKDLCKFVQNSPGVLMDFATKYSAHVLDQILSSVDQWLKSYPSQKRPPIVKKTAKNMSKRQMIAEK